MAQVIYFLPAEKVAQKFYNPTNSNDCVIYTDEAVWCPGSNPYQTNHGRISISAVCQDCESYIEWYPASKTLACYGKPKLKIRSDLLKEYLDPIEVLV